MSVKKDILWRFGLVYLVLAIMGLAIIGKIIYLQFFEKVKWSAKSEVYPLQKVEIEANRGDICTSDGRLLALSLPFYEIRLDLTVEGLSDELFYANLDSLSRCLASLFRDKSYLDYKRDLIHARNERRQYYLIKSDVSYEQMIKAREFPILRLKRYKGGAIFVQKYKRIRPNGMLAARTIGSTNRGEGGNIVGLEGAFDEILSGKPGIKMYRRIADRLSVPVSDGNEIDPQDGKDIITTIDLNLQDVAHNALLNQLKMRNARHGTAVLMEVKTGEIKAIANLEKNSKGEYREGRNYAIGESTEPGSTFKLASLIVALEDGYVNITDTIDTGKGIISYHDITLEDSGEKGYGRISVKRAFESSSNVGISQIIYKNYKGKENEFVKGLYKLKLNQQLGLDIRGEGIPEINSPGSPKWSGISLPMMSIGYEVRITPLQLLAFYNAVANGGTMVKPMFVKEIRYRGNLIKRFNTEIIESRICSRKTIEKVHELLCGVVENGTAMNLKDPKLKIAGKTGTAQIPDKETAYRDKSRITYQASFVGYFPADNPKYSCIVVINAPSKDVYSGNLVAGPVFREIAGKVHASCLDWHEPVNKEGSVLAQMPYSKSGQYDELKIVLKELKIPVQDLNKESQWINTTGAGKEIILTSRTVKPGIVPDVSDMGLKDAIFLLENSGMKVIVKGRGTVRGQSVSPGSKIVEGQNIKLELSIID